MTTMEVDQADVYTDNPFIPDEEHFDLRLYGSQFYFWVLIQDSERRLDKAELDLVNNLIFDYRYPTTAQNRHQVLAVMDGLTYDVERRKQVLGGMLDRFEASKATSPFIDRVIEVSYRNRG